MNRSSTTGVFLLAVGGLALAGAGAPGKPSTAPRRMEGSTLSSQLALMDGTSSDLQNQLVRDGARLAADGGALANDNKALDGMDSETSEYADTKKKADAEAAEVAREQAALQNDKSLLAQNQAAKQSLVEATGGTEAGYQAILSGKSGGGVYVQHAALDAQSRVINNGGGPCGDYPPNWCAAAPDSLIHFGGSGFLNRECVAYAAYERWKHGQPFATGNAGDWPGNSSTPTVGSVAVWNHGTVSSIGHVAYVTAVTANSITISEFNWHPFLYDSRTIPVNSRGWPSRFWN